MATRGLEAKETKRETPRCDEYRKTILRSGRGNKLTGQIGEYLVCAELGRRGLIATPFSGNVPTFDVLATDELCRTVPIQVKASRSDNWPSDARHWMDVKLENEIQDYSCRLTLQNPDLIYVCVAIAARSGGDRFFILTKSDLQGVCIAAYSSFMSKHQGRRPRNPYSYENRYYISGLQGFENNWDLISSRLKASSPDHSLTTDQSLTTEEESVVFSDIVTRLL